MEIYEVGGAVRDSLLGLPINDRDWVVVGGTPAALEKQGFRRVGSDFPVFLHPDTHEEYALARTERKVAPGYKGFTFDASDDVTLEQDLQRRDLTINAIARAESGEIIDPYGGRKDLRSRVLRHVSDAFSEDPLRVLRVARFAARFAPLGFGVADETIELMRNISRSGELDALQAERTWTETLRALNTARPDVFVEVLRAAGALAPIFPEIHRLFGVPQPQRQHPEIDTGVHTLMALRQAVALSDNECIRFAVLVHDLGKGTTPAELLPEHHGHEERSVALIQALAKRLRIPKRFESLAIKVAEHHNRMHRIAEMRPAKVHDLLVTLGALRRSEALEEFILACEADARGRAGLEEHPYPQGDYLRGALNAAAAIRSDAVPDDIPAGPDYGAALRTLRIEAIETFKQTF
jgi:tRNA nucleotidyltransferase (CCA-adding enzyme)